MKVKITDISTRDGDFYLIGRKGTGHIEHWKFDDWSYCRDFVLDDGTHVTLYEFKYIEVPEPSSMSELGNVVNKYTTDPKQAIRFAWLATQKSIKHFDDAVKASKVVSEQFDTFCKAVYPKKHTWIQKIRGYDDLQARCNASEAMRDHYKEVFTSAMDSLANQASIITEKSRELNLMTKVADNWQAKLIEANRRNDNLQIASDIFTKELNSYGRRLKFSVGHNHITIIVGNPVTACVLFNEIEEKYFDAHAICNPKDQYNWKQGAIQALTNLMDNWFIPSEIDRGEWFNKLFKKYPELKVK